MLKNYSFSDFLVFFFKKLDTIMINEREILKFQTKNYHKTAFFYHYSFFLKNYDIFNKMFVFLTIK